MGINYYEFNKNAEEHEEFLLNLTELCSKYNISPIPEVESYSVEDSVIANYVMDNGMRLSWGCTWCEDRNKEEFKTYLKANKEEWLDHVNPFRHIQELIEKENKKFKELSEDELMNKINEQNEKINELEKVCGLISGNTSGKLTGLSIKLLYEKMELSKMIERCTKIKESK